MPSYWPRYVTGQGPRFWPPPHTKKGRGDGEDRSCRWFDDLGDAACVRGGRADGGAWRRAAADGEAGRRGRHRRLRLQGRPRYGKAVGQNTGHRLHPRRQRGTRAQFRHCYDRTWGKYKKRTKPAAGNHEYYTSGARPYFDYFGRRAGKPGKGYYSYDRGSWHIVALNSNCARAGGCGAHSPQGRWLRRNLRKHRARCTLAYFHHPLFSSGEHGNQTKTRPIWRALYRANADVILSGHDHDYERFAPQRPDGTRNPRRGIREFVVGTGGAERGPFGTIQPHSQARNARTYGVLKLKLRSRSYRWRFVPVAGRIFTDSGKDRCH